ncbi:MULTISPECIES: LysR family transcriptional regulator [Rhodococcus]|uniref:LysR family transcriptional regulator n=1 Tax=Rhodococcus pseudokoreensis TaxID=2811421 RepID=A0A974WCJ6_9NOCA|nr:MULTISPECIES: LysR substrate-binding domain-containing protein [Rhodococcus]MBV6756382.1 LysR family transcriptional regulator [Rhodococcus opacus]QSE94877.1 LysR family transcriptional regulator [Rhodococcus pseudokoreensis]
MDIHPRVLRYFLVVAEELHFRRAAERLYITGPALSQQIRHLERELGFEVLRRTSRSVDLTDKGAELVPLARAVVDASDTLSAWAARADQGTTRIRIGFMATGAGELTQGILNATSANLPLLDVHLKHLEWGDQTRALLENRVDVVFTREPVRADDLRCTVVLSEHRVVVLPSSHPLANRSTVTFREIAEETFLPSETGSQEWIDYWLVNPRPDGSAARTGPSISTVEEMLEQCAAGTGIAITAESVPHFYAHPGVRFVVVEDLAPTRVLLCARSDNSDPTVRKFEQLVEDIAHR